MNQTSDAIAFSVEKQTDLDSRETTYFRTFRPLTASIYRPEALAQHRTLMAEVTLLKIERDRDSGLYLISGSMRSSDIQAHGILGRHFYFIDYSVRGKRMRLVAEMTEVDEEESRSMLYGFWCDETHNATRACRLQLACPAGFQWNRSKDSFTLKSLLGAGMQLNHAIF